MDRLANSSPKRWGKLVSRVSYHLLMPRNVGTQGDQTSGSRMSGPPRNTIYGVRAIQDTGNMLRVGIPSTGYFQDSQIAHQYPPTRLLAPSTFSVHPLHGGCIVYPQLYTVLGTFRFSVKEDHHHPRRQYHSEQFQCIHGNTIFVMNLMSPN